MNESADIIRGMKGLPDGRGLRFPIRDAELNVIGFLRGFDMFFLEDDEIIETMAKFHTLYKESFLTQFDVTPENKKNWLEHSVLPNDRKMLFLVETLDGRIIGQDGFTLMDGGVFELDGSMRWGRGGNSGIFVRSTLERAAICFFLLGRDTLKFEIFRKNKITIDNALSLGMEIVAERRLNRSLRDGIVKFSLASGSRLVNTDETLLEFRMGKSQFGKSYGALRDHPCWEGFLE
ncbi:MAG: hypothetical protein LBT31_10005 [Synergistaceae bacterium]|jgi:hypothetical protein|nr:hypothetical protein [Synergistaceae bacterium]